MTKRQRRSIRLQSYDYTQPGAYFVTICTHQRMSLFGEVINGEMQLNQYGKIVGEVWFKTVQVRRNVVLHSNELIVMPNHLHGIIRITDVATIRHVASPNGTLVSGSLGAIIGQIKSIATKQINALRNAPGAPVWQRNYWEHIIRTEVALDAIRHYIVNNPQRWHLDRYNNQASAPDPMAREIWTMLS